MTELTGTLSADKVAVSLGSKSSTVNFGTSLDNNDSVTGGSGTADTVTATMTGKTAITGASQSGRLKISILPRR